MRDAIVDRLVRRFGRDEPALARGRYSTQEDIDARREKVLSHDFVATARGPRFPLLRRFLDVFQGLASR
jgi:hypothetical protein